MNLILEGIKLIYVFDGKAPDLKKKTWEKRREIKERAREKYEKAVDEEDIDAMGKYSRGFATLDNEKIEESKELLKAMGIAVIQAPGEGEAQASYIAQSNKDIYGVSSQDYDCLMFKAPKLIQNLGMARRRKTATGYTEVFPQLIELNGVLQELGIDHEQIICLGILCGTDYNPGGVKGLGPKKSLNIVKEYKTKEKIFEAIGKEEKLQKYQADFDWEAIYKEIESPNVDKEYKIEFPKIDKEKIKEMLMKHEFSEERINSQLDKIDEIKKKAAQRTLF
jgi:flap endonuclease-1